MFDALHDLEVKALSLQYDCLHPAFEQYGDIANEATAAALQFSTKRASFITDHTALEVAKRSLEDADEKVQIVRKRYLLMEKLVNECLGTPRRSNGVLADQKWGCGRVSSDPSNHPEVLLTDGIKAVQSVIEYGNNNRGTLRFECRVLQSPPPSPRPEAPDPDPSTTLILARDPSYIVGWTLSCRTAN